MRVTHFRILRFRSIQDTGWVAFSSDNVTALVGQNESGKSSVLDALMLISSDPAVSGDDARVSEDPPEVQLRLDVSSLEASELAPSFGEMVVGAVYSALCDSPVIEVSSCVVGDIAEFRLSEGFRSLLEEKWEEVPEESRVVSFSGFLATIKENIWRFIPDFLLFREEDCQLPNTIEVREKSVPDGPGAEGARNFLVAAGLDVRELLAMRERERSTAISRALSRLNGELHGIWSQVLGDGNRIKLECELAFHAVGEGGLSGQPYLRFWVCDGHDKQYPSQRSKGTRWFISFFLHLLASQNSKSTHIYLLDEPGAYLHATAQRDVVKLIERLANDVPVVYTTHSPYLLDQKKMHRVVAVERRGSGPESLTVLKRGMELAVASPLTLAPILSIIGVDLSQQQVIKKERNVILEEVSAYYYFEAFRSILSRREEYHFVAAGGVDNVRLLVDLFIAWGIEYTVLVDGDSHGKKVVREIKQKWQLTNELAERKLKLLDGFDGVEDLFDQEEFRNLVLNGRSVPVGVSNSEAMKRAGLSKPMVAVDFWLRASSGDLKREDLSADVIHRFNGLFDSLDSSFE